MPVNRRVLPSQTKKAAVAIIIMHVLAVAAYGFYFRSEYIVLPRTRYIERAFRSGSFPVCIIQFSGVACESVGSGVPV